MSAACSTRPTTPGPVESVAAASAEVGYVRREGGAGSGPDAGQEERIAQLEATVAELRQEIIALRAKIEDLFGDG